MVRTLNRISPRGFQTLKTPGMHADGGGLYLVITSAGARRWAFIYQWTGKRREMGLGSALVVGLAEARELAAEARKQVAAGVDPIAARRQAIEDAAARAHGNTFARLAAVYIRSHRRSWRNRKHARQWVTTLRTHAKALRPRPVDEITTEHVLAVLKSIWREVPDTASRVRGRIERILDAAKAQRLIADPWTNPARWKGHLDLLLSRPEKLRRGHHAAMPIDEVGAFALELRTRQALSARLLEFIVLTVPRCSEARLSTAREFDLAAKVWTVPGERMKSGREHRVPLSDRAVEILAPLLELSGPGEFVFRDYGARKPISVKSIENLMERMGADAYTIHGFRSTFRDWAGDRTTFPRELAEQALAHKIGDAAEQAYRRSDALERRREVMDAWAAFCSQAANEKKPPAGAEG